MPVGKQEIDSLIQDYFGIQGAGLAAVGNLFERRQMEKGEHLLKMRQYARQMHFVKSGYFRMFAYSPNEEKEVTQWIARKGMFLTDLASFYFNTPARWNIQALSACEVFTIAKADYLSIGEYVANWPQLEKLFLTKCFITLENRVFDQLSLTAEEKVKRLLDDSPNLFIQVPLQYIASMLGMTPETLSRVRKKWSS
ncbi:MAG: Crp/Fnr family transcriptional regulator [Bacteroidota bacterium]